MKYTDIFRERIGCSSETEVFKYLMETLKERITGWDYFVNWAKVFDNIKDVEIDLNILNYLVGKENIEDEFSSLLDKHPSISRLIPVLVACREAKFDILTHYGKDSFTYETYDFPKYKGGDKSKVIEFAKRTGFLSLLKNRRIKSIVDYVIGVEVGLDSNARKNRGGKSMEEIVEFFVGDICARRSLQYLKAASSKSVRESWGADLKVDKADREVDFAINSGRRLFLIEANFYAGGGSKLKSTAGEYRTMFDFWNTQGHQFIWVTDGGGWRTSRSPLLEAFNHIDYILNLEMLVKGVLEDIVISAIL